MINKQTLDEKLEIAKKNLRVAIEESKTLKAEKQKLEDRLKEVDQRINQLHGTHYNRGGVMDDAKQAVAKAELELEHFGARKVEWIERGWCNGEYLIQKVTPKRIYACLFGCTRAEMFNLDGTTVSAHGKAKIDIAKTFPEGVENYK